MDCISMDTVEEAVSDRSDRDTEIGDRDTLAEQCNEEVGQDGACASESHQQAESLAEEVGQDGACASESHQQAESLAEETSPAKSCGGCSSASADQSSECRSTNPDDSEDFVGSPRDFLIETAIADEVKQFFSMSPHCSSLASSSSSSAIGSTVVGSSSSSSSASANATRSALPGTVLEVNIKLIDGTTTKLEMSSEMSGLDLKQLILEQMNVAVERQRLIARGRVIQDTDLIGQHITASGQTIHLVQRPVPTGNESAASQSTQNSDQDGPQIRIQQAGGEVPIQAELSEILGAMLGSVGRGVGMGAVLHATPVLRVPRPGQGAPQAANGSNVSGSVPNNIVHALGGSLGASPLSSLLLPGPAGGSRQAPLSSPPSHRGWLSRVLIFAALLITLLLIAMPLMAWCIVQIESNYVLGFPPWHIWALGFHLLGLVLGLPSVYLAFRSRSPLRGLRALLAQTDGAGLDSNQTVLTQAIAAMTLQPQQMVFSQGFGLGANVNVVTTAEAEGFPQAQTDAAGDQHSSAQTFPWPASHEETLPHDFSQTNSGGALPWQDLTRFNDQALALLGRTRANRQLPPARMPHGELCSFLSILQSSTNQLGVGMGELQANFLDGAGMSAEQLRNLAETMEAAARSLSSAAVALRGVEQ